MFYSKSCSVIHKIIARVIGDSNILDNIELIIIDIFIIDYLDFIDSLLNIELKSI